MREKKFGKLFLTWLLAATMVLTLLPVSMLAADDETDHVLTVGEQRDEDDSGGGISEGNGEGEEPPTVPEDAAKIVETGTTYQTVAMAIADAGAGQTVKLLKDVTESITISKSLTLDLGGFTLTAEEGERVIDVTPEVNLDVLEYDFRQRDNIENPYFPDIGFGIGGFRESNFEKIGNLEIPEANVKIMNGTITGGDVSDRNGHNLRFHGGGGGIRISSCNVEIENCTITGNMARFGGGIFCSTSVVNDQPYSKVVITDCKISNNTACASGDQTISAGGGISSCRCDLTLSGLTVSGNKVNESQCDGGGISARGGKFYMEDTTVQKNEAADNAGGILLGAVIEPTVKESIQYTITGGTVANNESKTSGGGIYVDNESSQENRHEDNKIIGTTVEKNIAGFGGGIFVGTAAKLMVEGNSLIRNNKSTNKYLGGGGIYATIADLHLGNASVTNNEAINGGGIFAQSAGDSSVELKLSDGAQVEGNRATNGAGIFVWIIGEDATMSAEIGNGASVKNNVAENAGGGIYTDKSTVTVAEGGAVQGNEASMGGGIYMNASSAAVAKGSVLYNNKATYGGDDLFAFGNNTLSLPDAKSMSGDRKLTGDGKEITGWYYDGYKENSWTTRWSEEKDGVAYYDKYDAETATANYALKAAHGLMCTVTYTDGVENEEIFADKVCVVEQDSATPAFDGNPTRSGYTFMGWSPTVAETVTADVTYIAQWKRNGGHHPSKPDNTVEIPDEDALGLNTDDHFAYIIGYPDGSVQPNGQITRAEATTIFFRLLTEESRSANLTKTNGYTDVASDAWYNTAVSTMTKAGIVDGYPDGTFRPDAPITRAEMAKIISLFAKLDKSESRFSDIAGHWAEAYIRLAAGNGWIAGYPDGTFGPQRNITRAETATMINRVLDRVPSEESHLLSRGVMQIWPDANPGDWFYLAMQEATNSHDYERNAKWAAADEQWTALRETRDWKALEQ